MTAAVDRPAVPVTRAPGIDAFDVRQFVRDALIAIDLSLRRMLQISTTTDETIENWESAFNAEAAFRVKENTSPWLAINRYG
jgi:hypothetical protein